jgi:hypothetical protein
MDRHSWGDIHFYLSLGILVLMLVHIALHWRWVKGTFRGMFSRASEGEGKRKTMSPLGWTLFILTALALVLSIVLPFAIEPEVVTNNSYRSSQNNQSVQASEFHINGRTTFAEIEAATGVSSEKLKEFMGIPADAPDNERLSQLRREHDFDMEGLRTAVEQLSQK